MVFVSSIYELVFQVNWYVWKIFQVKLYAFKMWLLSQSYKFKNKLSEKWNKTEILPFKNKIEPIPNDCYPYHLGSNCPIKLKPKWKINRKDIPGVSNIRHKI